MAPLILHITAGGDDSGTPMCLPAAELRIGARDIYLGTVHGVDVFEMRSHMDSHFWAGSFVLDVSRGLPVGLLPDTRRPPPLRGQGQRSVHDVSLDGRGI